MKQLNKYKSILVDFIFYLAILFFIIGFNFSDNMVNGWYQQFMPNLNGRNITDVFFLDSLTGWSVTNATNQATDTTYILKTTNSGDNWTIEYRKIQTGGGFPGYFKVYFLNQSTGYTCGVTGIDKTTNGGTNWISLNAPFNAYLDMSVINENTIWIASSNSLTGGVFRTTNGGANWTPQGNFGSSNPSHIYMYNTRIGFIDGLKKTTNGGESWSPIAPSEPSLFFDMHFVDSLTGWKATQLMKKTTDGGLTWVNQPLPTEGNIVLNYMNKFSVVNRDTIWGIGGTVYFNGNGNRGMIFRTTNGGNNWLFQIPDTTIHIGIYYHIKFINGKNGWAYSTTSGVHTNTGGNDTSYTGLKNVTSKFPEQFKLYQNYPNPFNPHTIIKYDVRNSKSEVRIVVFDIIGKEITTLVNEIQNSGTFEVVFNGSGFSSGIYFYSLYISNNLIDTKKMLILK